MPVRLSTYLEKTFGEKVYRLSLSSGCGCPNRDGGALWKDKEKSAAFFTGGCTFCSEGGSGEFAMNMPDIKQQIVQAKALISKKTNAKKFIAYFQSYTNTYGDADRLKKLYKEAIEGDDIVALSIGTRPDCIDDDILSMLKELNAIKPVWVELGLQTIHKKTALRIHRGYELPVFDRTYQKLKEAGLTVIVHVILGLPGEEEKDMLDTVKYLSELKPELDGIKLQNLQILKGTLMKQEFEDERYRKDFHIFSMEEYTDLVVRCLKLLPERTVVHRMTGDGPRKLLVEPLWVTDKKRVMNMLTKKTEGIWNND